MKFTDQAWRWTQIGKWLNVAILLVQRVTEFAASSFINNATLLAVTMTTSDDNANRQITNCKFANENQIIEVKNDIRLLSLLLDIINRQSGQHILHAPHTLIVHAYRRNLYLFTHS